MTTASERFGPRGFAHKDAEEVLREKCLVDQDLTPEAERARRVLVNALIEPTGRRACAVFLETDDYARVQKTCGDLMGCLLMECLPRLVRELGGQITFAGRFDDRCDAVLNPIQHTVQVDGQARHIVDEGYLFICLPEERLVVSSHCQDSSAGLVYVLTVRSNRDSAAFFRGWKDFTRAENYLRGQAFFADGELIQRRRTYGWDDIALAANVRRAVEMHVQGFLRNRERLRQLGVKTRRGLILAGPPGTGKTLLGKVLADTLDCSFIWVSPRHISHTQSFQHILEVARFVAPTVLFLEDLDLFAEDRNARSWLGLGELMNQLDGAVDNEDLVTIATTNRLEVIEKALRNRPGRFDRVLHLDEMDAGCRRGMLERLMAKAVVSADDVAHLVSVTDGYTGAQIEELVNTLYILAVDKHDDASGNGDGKPAVVIDRSLIAAAREEFQVELKACVGFHAS